jgi:uncharacterized protein YodC (DUF2158 family)
MNIPTIQQGDRVELKSGGPVMTVECIFPGDDGMMANSKWFDKSGDLKTDNFYLTSLKKAE